MTPILLSQWADKNGIPRRTAYNWAKSGRLNVPLRRTLTGRLMVLEDDDLSDADVHPFVDAYAESLSLPVGDHTGDFHYSLVLETWGINLYDAVAPDLRPVVLHLALDAACRRPKRDALFRFADWIARIELPAWYTSLGYAEAADRVGELGEIRDSDTYFENWPTSVSRFEWRTEQDDLVHRLIQERSQVAGLPDDGAALSLATAGTIALDTLPIAARRERLRHGLGKLGREHHPDKAVKIDGPDAMDLFDLQALYSDPMWSAYMPAVYRTARTMCELTGVDPDGPSPADGHVLNEIGYPACQQAARQALAPHLHQAHIREIDAFRRIALGKPW